MAVCRDVDGFDIGEGRQHHQHFGRFEDLAVVLHIAVVHLDIGLGEEAENLGQQVAFGLGQVAVPVLHVIRQGHFLGQPVDALLGEPGFVGPGITERLIDGIFGQQIGAGRLVHDFGVASMKRRSVSYEWCGPDPANPNIASEVFGPNRRSTCSRPSPWAA